MHYNLMFSYVIFHAEHDGIVYIAIKNVFSGQKKNFVKKNNKKKFFFCLQSKRKAPNRFFTNVGYMKIDVIFYAEYDGMLYFTIK